METVLNALVILAQLALAGFVMWGGWLCVKEWLRADRAARAPAAPTASNTREAAQQSFERVASLVLLALLCTTIAGFV